MEPKPIIYEHAPKAELYHTVMEIHQQAALGNFAAHGYQMAVWDTAQANQIEAEIALAAAKGEGTIESFAHIRFDETAITTNDDGIVRRKVHLGSLLPGYKGFSLVASRTPMSVLERLWPDKPVSPDSASTDFDYSFETDAFSGRQLSAWHDNWTLSNEVTVPFKAVEVFLHRETPKDKGKLSEHLSCDPMERAIVYISEDSPPQIVHNKYIESANNLVTMTGGIPGISLLIQLETEEGPQSRVREDLSDEACLDLAGALVVAHKTFAATEYFSTEYAADS